MDVAGNDIDRFGAKWQGGQMAKLPPTSLGEGQMLTPIGWVDSFDELCKLGQILFIDALRRADREIQGVWDEREAFQQGVQLRHFPPGGSEKVIGRDFQEIDLITSVSHQRIEPRRPVSQS